MLDHILAHPLYIPFLLLNVFIIYKVIKLVLDNNQEKDDDDDHRGGIAYNDDPVLDLPPGVGLPNKESRLSSPLSPQWEMTKRQSKKADLQKSEVI